MIDNVEAATEVIKRIYRSWRFSDKKVTVAEATALGLMEAGLLADVEFADLAEVPLDELTVDRLVSNQAKRRRGELLIGKSVGGQLTHYANPKAETWSLCKVVKGTLRLEHRSERVGCSRCQKIKGNDGH